ncbi:AAA family ATPase [Aquincola sp. S2]|uniref:AAA family ATPase n=1 Tax=Pseudaquabacterium terrae TaxID=2732868 RepID=A0ABX2ECW6_9BURK|nr:AAA family ATPase [Aquabacterium terrae]NRF66359.1 AAA family ATPase [Aquabacterium terrae]
MRAEPAPSPSLMLHLAGAPQLACEGGAPQPLATIDALLLAWLAIEGPTPRERLAGLLWPASSAEAARNALRQRLFRLRHALGGEAISGNRVLALAPGVLHDLHAASTLLGPLETDADGALADWLAAERRRRREAERQRLLQRIAVHEQGGQPAAALPLAEALVALDPLREDAQRCLVRLHYLAGDRAAALQAFDRCEQLLKHELGARPSPETLALLATIEAAQPAAPAAAAAAQRHRLPAALLRPPRLVGRAAELALLHGVLQRRGRLLLTGDAGLGKSRLLQALDEDPAGALVVAGRPGDALVPYATLARLLRGVQARWPALLDAAPQPAHLAPLLPELAGADEAPAPRGDQFIAALQAVLQAAQAQLAGLVLDDLHFADDASLQLLPELVAGGGAWVLSSRPPVDGTALGRALAELAAAGPLDTLALQPLDDAALAAMVDSLALPGWRGDALAPALRARSGGNPLFALETLKLAWCEGQPLDAGTLPCPRSVGQLIDTALTALSAPALRLARFAAIAGIDFAVPLAEQALGSDALQLADAWGELEARQVLRGTAFTHDLMHEGVLAGIPQVLACHAHGTVAQWLEAHAGEPARIAAHWEAAGEAARALPALRAAAERAHAALREPERVGFLLRAADIAEGHGQPDDAFAWVTQALEAHMNTMRDAAGLPLLDRLDRLARTTAQRANAAGQRAWYRSNLGDGAGAIEDGQRALALAAEIDDPALKASISQRLGTALAMAGRFDEALPQLRAAEPWVDANGSSDTAAEFHGNLAAVLDNLGRPLEAAPCHQRVIRATQALADHSFQATARANLAVSRLNAGDVAGAREQLALAQQLISSFGLQGASAAFIAALQAQAARASGAYREALQWCDDAEALLLRARSGWLPVVQMHRAQIWLDLAQPARAQQALQAAQLDGDAPARLRSRHALLQGRLKRALGRDAAADFDHALALAPMAGWPEQRLTIRIERAALLTPAAAAAELLAVAAEARALGLCGVALAAWLRAAALARRGDDAPRRVPETVAAAAQNASRSAQALMVANPALEPNQLYRAERWLGPAQAALARGDPAAAAALADEAWAWITDTAAHRVPEAQRDGYLHRHPVHDALARLRVLPARTRVIA